MESTQNKLYEIEESACVDQNNLKNNYVIDEDLIGEENKNGKVKIRFDEKNRL